MIPTIIFEVILRLFTDDVLCQWLRNLLDYKIPHTTMLSVVILTHVNLSLTDARYNLN